MKKIILFYFVMLAAIVAQAQRVSVDTAQTLAQNFFLKHTGQAATFERISFAGIQNIYIFNRSDADGFIIVAGDKNVRPVLVYSFDDKIDPENNPEAFAAWLQSYDISCEKPAANSKNQTLWNNLLTYSASAPTLLGEGEYIAPMVPCVWKQSSPYEMYCPDSAGVHAAAGCVPIAQAQIMRYWNFPKRAMGYESYFEPPYGILSTSFHTYDWDNMFDTLRTTTTEEQKQNVAHLIADIGISGHSDYGPGETNGSFVLWTHFQYNPDSVRYEIKEYYTSAQWNAMVLEELRKGRPLLYVGMTLNSGHAFVVDGYKYNEDNGGDMFHFNLGWGGLANGYYYLDSANFGFTSQGAYFGLEPDSSIAISTPILLLPSNACDTTFVLRSDYRSSDAVNISVDHDWLSLSQTSALGGGEYTDVQISALQNTTEAKRYATITITHRGKTKKLYVVQDAPIYDAEYGWYGYFSAENTNTFYTKEQPGTEFIICPESFANFSAGQKIERICYHSFSTNDSITIKIYEDPHANWNYGLTTSGQSRYADTICGTLVYSQEYTSAQGGAHIIDLNTPYTITDKPFWIGIYNNSKSHIVNIANDEEVIFDQIEDKNVNASRFINNKSFLGKRADNVLFNIASTLQSYTNPENAGMSYKLVMNKYGISFYVGDGQTNISATANNTVYGTVSGGGKHNLGETVTLVATPKSGCRFLHWTSGGNIVSTDAELSLVAKHDTYLVAHFTDRDFTITAVSSDENRGTVSEIGYYDLNETVTLTATPTYGYQFDTWTCNGTVVSSEQTYTFPATGNATYTANFVPRTFTVTLSFEYNNNWGTVYGSGEYLYGETVTISAVANENYVFECWISNHKEVSEDATYSFVITQDTTFYAGFIGAALSYTIIAGNGGTVSNEGTHRAVYGVYKLISATPNEGYKFVNWTSGKTVVSNAASFRLKVEQDTVLTANFAQINYCVIETSATEGGTVTSGGTYEEGEYVTLVATPDNDCRFINWTVNGEIVSTKASYRFIASANATYVAHFVHYCEISATANNTVYGTVSGGGEYNLGETVTLVATPKSGCDFVNWTLDGTVLSTEASYTFTATANAALTANFTPGTFTVTLSGFNGNNEGGTLVGAGNFKYGDTVTVSAIPDAMYEFAGWYNRNYRKESSQETYSFVLTQETTLIGYFNGIPLTYSVIAGNGGTVSTTGGTSRYKNDVTITATPNSGYKFVNWTSGETVLSTSASLRFKLEQDTSITANFAQIQYYMIAVSAENGTVSGGGTYEEGNMVTIVATPSDGYRFAGWTSNGTLVSTNATYSFTASENLTLVANMEQITYNVAATASEGCSVSGAGTYTVGETVTLKAVPNEGYEFIRWTSNASEIATTEEFSFVLTCDTSFVAIFKRIGYNMVAALPNNDNYGTVSGGGSYRSGTEITLTATPVNEYYYFVNWTSGTDTLSDDNTITFTATGDSTIVANFKPVTFTVKITTIGGRSTLNGSSPKSSYSEDLFYGSEATISAIPPSNSEFGGWALNGTLVSSELDYTFTVTQDAEYVATFIKDVCTITVEATEGGSATGGGTYQKGETITLVATPDKGYKFVGWTANNGIVSTSAEYSFMVEEAITIVANFMVDNDNTAIEETGNQTFTIYPNPATTGFFVENAEGTVELLTLGGKRIFVTEISGNAWISTVELKAGTYLVRYGTQVRTLVKK
ncbi:MAG: C10 family peptidase [Bacteroidales bacterium]|nr:C10 family peptidase [Bacteroidales bacterium]